MADASNDQPNQAGQPRNKKQLIIALDFGTTYSGIAYAFMDVERPDIKVIRDWLGTGDLYQPKIPSTVSYDPSDSKIFTWGPQNHIHNVVQGIKLLLDPSQQWPTYLPQSTTEEDLAKIGKTPVQVVADYMRELFKHAMSKLKSAVTSNFFEEDCEISFVLTVPAVWSDKAKDATLKAAAEVGMDPITLYKEPTAAALYTLHTMRNFSLEVGDAFVLCDAGGGMAGSLGLNRRFEKAVENLVGADQYVELCKTKGYISGLHDFEVDVKRTFSDEKDEEYAVWFPEAVLKDDTANNLARNIWAMQYDDVKAIFDPLVRDIELMVEEQVEGIRSKRRLNNHPRPDEIKGIFLVGGFGSNKYLKSCLERSQPGFQVIQPDGAWEAVMMGAVLSQFPQEAIIVSTQATRHYGVIAWFHFDKSRDAGRERRYEPAIGHWMVEKMTWYITRGMDMQREQRIKFPFVRYVRANPVLKEHMIFVDKLMQSENEEPPIYPEPDNVATNCVLRSDLSQVNHSIFKKRTGVDGLPYIHVTYDLIVTIKPAMMKFSIEVNGEEMGSVDANYN